MVGGGVREERGGRVWGRRRSEGVYCVSTVCSEFLLHFYCMYCIPTAFSVVCTAFLLYVLCIYSMTHIAFLLFLPHFYCVYCMYCVATVFYSAYSISTVCTACTAFLLRVLCWMRPRRRSKWSHVLALASFENKPKETGSGLCCLTCGGCSSLLSKAPNSRLVLLRRGEIRQILGHCDMADSGPCRC